MESRSIKFRQERAGARGNSARTRSTGLAANRRPKK